MRSGVTLVDVALFLLALYVGYWLGVFPRNAASAVFVASLGAASLKIILAALILALKGALTGGSAYAGGKVVQAVIKSHSDPPDAAQE